ncbi:MAG: hypothetical protein IJ335_05170 [Lachnospiraceae bacterium]|nr:hypothetical protein [Lachnospiraceae bacterium]
MKECAKEYLRKKGYAVNDEALTIISLCEKWYKNEADEDFHTRMNLNKSEISLHRMGFAKRCCADDANLCEVISVAPEKENAAKEFIEKLLTENRFSVRYREQLEKTSATGTVGAYIYLKNASYLKNDKEQITVKGGQIRINYVDADCIFPLTVENGLITECAFCATNVVRGKEKTTLVVFIQEEGRYKAETVVFSKDGALQESESSTIQLGEIKPFAVMTNAEVNNLQNMEGTGYGLPKIYNAIPLFKALDLCYNIFFGDLSKGDKLLFINELLACIEQGEDGKPRLTPQQKELFILLGEKLPTKESLIYEYNPKIRIEEITKAFELVLSLLSMTFGYGSKKYTFENGKITTATEYIGTRQDAMQELNKQRKNASDYISDIVHAAMWFSNTFQESSYNTDEALQIQFDDSYIEDRQAKLEKIRADALSFDIPKLTIMYLMEAYNMTEEDATELVLQKEQEKETDTDGEDED